METLNEVEIGVLLGRSDVGLNADWNCSAWSLGSGLFILDCEDGALVLVHRVDDEVTDLGYAPLTRGGLIELVSRVWIVRANVRALGSIGAYTESRSLVLIAGSADRARDHAWDRWYNEGLDTFAISVRSLASEVARR